jgi:predicted DNA repair protein MutK
VSVGLIALLDDVAGLAKVAAASLDDVAGQAARSGAKAAGVVIDDAAVTPRYLTGFSARRELPVVGRIAVGSLKNKLVYLLPAALVLSTLAPGAITPLLMIGGAYLCYEGAEKVHAILLPHRAHGPETVTGATPRDPKDFEDAKVRSAVQTDFILSAEIMAITLSTVPAASIPMQALVLAVVGVALTAAVYGGVALIVKADDIGVALAGNDRPVSGLFGRGSGASAPPGLADRLLRALTRPIGRGLVRGMPIFLKLLSAVGTAAMIWVGGGIIIHGLEAFGAPQIAHLVHDLAHRTAAALPPVGPFLEWLVTAAASGVFGLLLGAALIPVVAHVVAPLLKRIRAGKG